MGVVKLGEEEGVRGEEICKGSMALLLYSEARINTK